MSGIKALLVGLSFIMSVFQTSAQGAPEPWPLAKEIFHREFEFLKSYVVRDNLSSIYDIQTFTNSLLVRAIEEQEFGLLDSLSEILLNATNNLREVSWYPAHTWRTQDSVPLGRSYRMWLFPGNITIEGQTVPVRDEYHLSSSQFLFLVSQVLHAGLDAPQGKYHFIDSLIKVFPDLLLDNHYRRWIVETQTFQLSGWGCVKGKYNHREFLELKRTRRFLFKPTICPVVTDTDLFIIAGLSLVLATHDAAPERVPVSPADKELYAQYLKEAEELLAERVQLRPLTLPDGTLPGFAFDNGLYRDYKDHRFADYDEMTFPAENLRVKPSKDATWDVSHARRFLFIFKALEKAAPAAGLTLNYSSFIQGLAHQFYHVIYADTVRHLFANYINGDNGWYRVNYHGEGFGFPPYSMSQAALEGGWFFLGEYYPPIAELGNRIWNDFNVDPEVYNRYYGVVYRNFQPVNRKFSASPSGSERFVLLQWLPSLR